MLSAYGAGYTTSDVPAVADQQLVKNIQEKLNDGWFSKNYPNINIAVRNGNVTLSGIVETSSEKEEIEKEVRNMEGVRSLDSSRIKVQVRDSESREFPQDSYLTPEDEQLNKKIRENISKGWLWDSYKEISLNTKNGTVTLTGHVNSIEDQYKLQQEIQKINGVKSVISDLKIKEENDSNW